MIGPLVGALMITTVGVHAVFLLAAALMGGGALVIGRELRRHVARETPAPAVVRPSFAR